MAQAGIELEEVQRLAVVELGGDVRAEALDLAARILARVDDLTIPDDGADA